MTYWLLALGLTGLGTMLWLISTLYRIQKASECEATVEWAKSFSLSAYAPMERLLDDSDFQFLKNQPGYHGKITRELRAKRVRIYGAYLSMMARDFHRLHSLLQQYLVSAEVDAPEISAMLVQQKWIFLRSMLVARAQLKLYSIGIGHVSSAPLMEAMRKMGNLAGDVPQLIGGQAAWTD